MSTDLTALGLPPLAARVLACLAADSWSTSVQVAGQLGVSRPQVADALQQLVQLGMVERTRGRRPAPVRLAQGLVAAVDARVAELGAAREEDARRRRGSRGARRGRGRRGVCAEAPGLG